MKLAVVHNSTVFSPTASLLSDKPSFSHVPFLAIAVTHCSWFFRGRQVFTSHFLKDFLSVFPPLLPVSLPMPCPPDPGDKYAGEAECISLRCTDKLVLALAFAAGEDLP